MGGRGGGGGLLSPPRAAARANEPPCASGGGEEKWVRLRGEGRKAGSATASDAEANRRETGKGYTHTKANIYTGIALDRPQPAPELRCGS